MIGVIANQSNEEAVREFFELFKTPWEFYRDGVRYDVVLCQGDYDFDGLAAKLLLIYGSDETSFDLRQQVQIKSKSAGGQFLFSATTIPIYGPALRFEGECETLIRDRSGDTVAYVSQLWGTPCVRVGYDLFREVRTLLVQGQPGVNASIPALDLHIALLRQMITCCGLPLVEIPPVPGGYSFIACLTHDLDHPSIRRHKLDATMFGFLYRAIVTSALNTARRRLPLKSLFKNWGAALKLPFVYLGIAEDFWYGFDRYLEIEEGRPSTFFVIPFAGRAGHSPTGNASAARGAGYDVSDIAEKIQRLAAAGCEIGLHGIDAWNDSAKAREESKRISDVSGQPVSGVRMHWLYNDEKSPAVLEEAEVSYDSTLGYNQTVGFRSGTSQVFKPLHAKRLLELPLHVMDTALFYPDYLGLSDKEAWMWVEPLVENAVQRGGVLTVNWHDRSIAPERLWGNFYVRLLAELTARGALFLTAAQAVSWFRKRRSAVFDTVADGRLSVRMSLDSGRFMPALRIRFHEPQRLPGPVPKLDGFQETYEDTILEGRTKFHFPSDAPGARARSR